MKKSTAETKWCPNGALTLSEPYLCQLTGEIDGYNITIAAVNRLPNGDAHPNCLCRTDKCVSWTRNSDDINSGFCAKLTDNREGDDS